MCLLQVPRSQVVPLSSLDFCKCWVVQHSQNQKTLFIGISKKVYTNQNKQTELEYISMLGIMVITFYLLACV